MLLDIVAGDTLNFLKSVPNYSALDGWTLTYKLVPRVSGAVISFNGAAEGGDHRVNVAASTTQAWALGTYSYVAYVSKGSERYSIPGEYGQVKITQNFAAGGLTSTDSRTHAQIVLENVNAVLENRASKDQMEYTIGTRSLKLTPIADLLSLKAHYENLVFTENARKDIAEGKPNPAIIRVKFNNA